MTTPLTTFVCLWRPASGDTPGTALGWSFSSLGTVSHPEITPGSDQTERRRTEFAQTQAASAAGILNTSPVCFVRAAMALNRFALQMQFSLLANPAGSSAFFGLSASRTHVCLNDPSKVDDTVGGGFDATDPNSGFWQAITRNAASTTKIPVDGAHDGDPNPVARNTTDVYRLSMFDTGSGSIQLRFNKRNDLNVTNRITLRDVSLPRPNTPLRVHAGVGLSSAATARCALYAVDFA
jgi:hypothetical protein